MIKREALLYIIVGGLTTLLNMAVYRICYDRAGLPTLLANGLAWLVAVIFAYFANDRLVFTQTRGGGLRAEGRKMLRFFSARAASLLVDEGGMLLLVDVFSVNNMFAKGLMNVIIILLNFYLSKCFIFKK